MMCGTPIESGLVLLYHSLAIGGRHDTTLARLEETTLLAGLITYEEVSELPETEKIKQTYASIF